MKIDTFEQLEKTLSNFTSWHNDAGLYDFGGVMSLFLACVDNLKNNALEAELENADEYMSEEQIKFILELAKRIEAKK
jgi:hypothetical protein